MVLLLKNKVTTIVILMAAMALGRLVASLVSDASKPTFFYYIPFPLWGLHLQLIMCETFNKCSGGLFIYVHLRLCFLRFATYTGLSEILFLIVPVFMLSFIQVSMREYNLVRFFTFLCNV